jgi:hypothetical protein
MVALGTAHDALLTRCRATLPGPATRSTSSALDKRGSFPEPGWGKLDRRGAAHQAFALATLIFRDRRWWIRKSTSAGAQGPGFSGGPSRRNATTLRPVSLCAITVRRASASVRLGRTPILRSAFPEFAPALSPKIRVAKREPRSSLLRCSKPGSPARGRQAPHGSQT